MEKLMRFLHTIIIGFMLSVCIVLGVAPVIPKRKEEYTIEIKAEEREIKQTDTAGLDDRK
jgi:hypothetical protein